MGKKKPLPPKPKPARPKRLRLEDRSPIGLTEQQRTELRELYRPLGTRSGRSISLSDRKGQCELALERYLVIYIEALCADPGAQAGVTKSRQFVNVRRSVVREIGKLRGREPSPNDIIKELARHAPLPGYAVSAIRRDYLRVTV